jgi:hypothetical protein
LKLETRNSKLETVFRLFSSVMPLVTERSIVIPQRFCGPPTSGNGGYSCGLLAQSLPRAVAAECTIRKPIPIERELQIEVADHGARLLDGEEVVIEAVACDYEFALPSPSSYEEAHAAVRNSPAYRNHPFPTCFVCGPDRAEHDGLRVFPGPVAQQSGFTNLFAASWLPAPEFGDANGNVKSEFVWAAMDCPTGFAAGFPYEGKLVTGRLGVKQLVPVPVGEPCVLMSWSLGSDGRKCYSAGALFNAEQKVCAMAKATWIRL